MSVPGAHAGREGHPDGDRVVAVIVTKDRPATLSTSLEAVCGQSRPVDHVIGAFYLIRRPLFEQLGGFDERFFVYLEDLDLSARVHRAGHGIAYLAEAVGLHHGGGTSEQVKPQRLAYALESRIVYAFKHFTTISALAVAIVTLGIEPFPRLLRAIRRRSLTDARETGRGFMLLWRRVLRRAFVGSGTRGRDAR